MALEKALCTVNSSNSVKRTLHFCSEALKRQNQTSFCGSTEYLASAVCTNWNGRMLSKGRRYCPVCRITHGRYDNTEGFEKYFAKRRGSGLKHNHGRRNDTLLVINEKDCNDNRGMDSLVAGFRNFSIQGERKVRQSARENIGRPSRMADKQKPNLGKFCRSRTCACGGTRPGCWAYDTQRVTSGCYHSNEIDDNGKRTLMLNIVMPHL